MFTRCLLSLPTPTAPLPSQAETDLVMKSTVPIWGLGRQRAAEVVGLRLLNRATPSGSWEGEKTRFGERRKNAARVKLERMFL